MASFWQRFISIADNTASTLARAESNPKAVPRPTITAVTANKALTLTAIYRAIQIIATPVSAMKLTTFRYATGAEQKIDNPLLVNRPSLEQNRRITFYETVASLAMHGEAFWLKTLTGSGVVNSITLLDPTLVKLELDENGRVLFTYANRTYRSDQIEHLKLFSEVGNLRGLSPIATCKDDIAAALDLRSYATNWFSQAGVPTGVLKSNLNLSLDEAEEVATNWTKKQQNRQVAVLGQGFDYANIALSPKDALFTEVQNQAVQQIARLYGIPPRLLLTGVDGTSDTYTNLQDENQVFYRHTLMAYTDAIADALSNCLPRGTRCEFEFEGLFKADIAARYNYYKVGIDGGWLTAADIQKKEGIDG
jgi:HK97 family phage portal protein